MAGRGDSDRMNRFGADTRVTVEANICTGRAVLPESADAAKRSSNTPTVSGGEGAAIPVPRSELLRQRMPGDVGDRMEMQGLRIQTAVLRHRAPLRQARPECLRRLLSIRRAGVAAVPEGHRVPTRLSVDDNLRTAGSVLHVSHVKDALEGTYALFPKFAELRHRIAGTPSGGQQQMVVISHANDVPLALSAGR